MVNYDLKLTGFVGDWDFDAQRVRECLAKCKDREVHCLIDSPGGSVATALSIAAEFRNHGNVTVHFAGMNASAATIASMGARKVCIDSDALYLVHRCSATYLQWAMMNVEDIEKEIEELKKMQADLNTIDATVAQMYARKCKKSAQELLELMARNTWMNAATAKEWGFVDEIENDENAVKPHMTASMALSFVASSIPLPDIPIEDAALLKNLAQSMTDGKAQSVEPKPIINSVMKKFVALCAILALSAIELIEGRATLDEAQLQKIDETLAQANAKAESDAKALAEADTKIKALEARVAELEKAPAEQSQQVVDNGGTETHDELDEIIKVTANANEMMKFI